MAVDFHFEEVDIKSYPFNVSFDNIEDYISYIVLKRGYELGDISYIFCSDDYLLSVNKEYLDHDFYTDIITFDYVENGIVSGDLFISLDRVVDNAKSLSKDVNEEFIRVVTHGVLHLFGIKDKSEEERENMEREEDQSISLFNEKFSS